MATGGVNSHLSLPKLHAVLKEDIRKTVIMSNMKQLSSRTYLRPGPTPKMPQGLKEIMEGLARDVLKNNPTDVYRFCTDHMEKLLNIREAHLKPKTLTLEQKIEIAQKKVRERIKCRRQKVDKELKEFIKMSNMAEKLPVLKTIPVDIINNIQENYDDTGSITFTDPIPNSSELLQNEVDSKLSAENDNETKENIKSNKETFNEIVRDSHDSNVTESIKETSKSQEAGLIDITEKSNEHLNNYIAENSTVKQNDENVKSVDEEKISENFLIHEDIEKIQITNMDETKPLEIFNHSMIENDDSKMESVTETLLDATKINENYLDKTINIMDEMIYPLKHSTEKNGNMKNDNSAEKSTNELITDEISNKQDDKLHINSNENNVLDDTKSFVATKPADNLSELNITEQRTNSKLEEQADVNETKMVKSEPIHSEVNTSQNLKDGESDINDSVVAIEGSHYHEPAQMNDSDGCIADVIHAPTNEFINVQCLDAEGFVYVQNEKTSDGGIKSDPPSIVNSAIVTDKVNNKFVDETISLTSMIVTDDVAPESETNEQHQELFIAQTQVHNEEVANEVSGEQILMKPEEETEKDSGFECNDTDTTENLEDEKNIEIVKKENDANNEKSSNGENNKQTIPSIPNEIDNHTEIVDCKNDVIAEDSECNRNENSNNEKHVLPISESLEASNAITNNIASHIETDLITPDKDSSVEETTIDESIDNHFEHDDNTGSPDETASNTSKNQPMDLETAAITIQKVFRTFLFKSRTSTLDDIPNYEGSIDMSYIPIEESTIKDDIKPTEEEFGITSTKDKRTLGLSRMDTVLQTVNEEKSLSLSTDDSSTLSSAATTIQAHVRGFLVRSKLNSYKTNSSTSLVNSEGPSATSTEMDIEVPKNKTVLNIHIVPDGGHFISRDESIGMSIDLPLDASPRSANLHPLGYDKSVRRKQLKREDAIQSVSPPSNNSGKLSEDIESVKEFPISHNETDQGNTATVKDQVDGSTNIAEIDIISSNTTPTQSTTTETVIVVTKDVKEDESCPEVDSPKETRPKGHLTKMSSDEMDVMSPFTPHETISSVKSESSKLMHSGEFHDILLPTRVSRNESSVVRGE